MVVIILNPRACLHEPINCLFMIEILTIFPYLSGVFLGNICQWFYNTEVQIIHGTCSLQPDYPTILLVFLYLFSINLNIFFTYLLQSNENKNSIGIRFDNLNKEIENNVIITVSISFLVETRLMQKPTQSNRGIFTN